MKTPWIIILCHGNWGKYMVDDVRRMFGLKEGIFVHSLMPEISLESYRNEVEKTVLNSPEGSVLVADLYGGTTSNTAIYLGMKHNRDAISGLNVQLLLNLETERQESSNNLAERVLNGNENMYVNLIKKFKDMMK